MVFRISFREVVFKALRTASMSSTPLHLLELSPFIPAVFGFATLNCDFSTGKCESVKYFSCSLGLVKGLFRVSESQTTAHQQKAKELSQTTADGLPTAIATA